MKQPRITAQITFLLASEDGRESLPNDLSDGRYQPHVVVGDPNQRKALFVNNVAQEKYLGVAFVGSPSNVVAGEPFLAELALMYWPNVSYDSLISGATFTVREGPHVVGFGTVQTVLTNGAAQQIVRRERRERVSHHDWSGDAGMNSRRRVNSNVGRLRILFSCQLFPLDLTPQNVSC